MQSLFQECRKVGPSPFHECSKAGGTEAQDFGDHGPHSERILTTGDQCDQELLGRQRPHRLRFDPGVDLFLKFVDHAACRPASLRGVKALHEIRMARGLADDIRHEIRVARQRGVIRIDELLDLRPSGRSDAIIWMTPGAKEAAIRSQTARARSVFDRKW